MVLTTHAAHATELASSLVVAEWDGLLVVGGDGLLFEVVQGLMDR